MIICECCGNGYHDTCLKPALKELPNGPYYCPECLTINAKNS